MWGIESPGLTASLAIGEHVYRMFNEMNILKNSIPDFIKNDKSLSEKIIKISNAKPEDGGEGALYIFLKNKFR